MSVVSRSEIMTMSPIRPFVDAPPDQCAENATTLSGVRLCPE